MPNNNIQIVITYYFTLKYNVQFDLTTITFYPGKSIRTEKDELIIIAPFDVCGVRSQPKLTSPHLPAGYNNLHGH